MMFRRRPRVFLSYSRRDSERAAKLYSHLQEAGCDLFMDTRAIEYGEDFQRRVALELRRSDFVLAVVSANSFERSPFVGYEILTATDLVPKKHKSFLIPVRLLPVELPGAVATANAFDLFSDDDWPPLAAFLKRNHAARQGRKLMGAVAGAALLAGALALIFPMLREPEERPRPALAAPAGQAALGVTLHVLEPGAAQSCDEKLIDRKRWREAIAGQPLFLHDKVILSVEPGYRGFPYFLNRDFYADGSTGKAEVFYPPNGVSDSPMRANGQVMQFPPQQSGRYCFELNSADSNKQLSRIEVVVLMSRKKIPDATVFWPATGDLKARVSGHPLRTLAGDEQILSGSRGFESPPPRVTFTNRIVNDILQVRFDIPVGKRP